MEVAFVGEFVDGERVFRHVDAAGDAGLVRVGDGQPLEETYCQRVVDGRLPGLIPDTALVPATQDLSVTATVPVGSHVGVPVRLPDGTLYGTMCCFSRKAEASLNERDLKLVQMVGDLVGRHIARTRLDHESRVVVAERLDLVVRRRLFRSVFQPIRSLRDGHVNSVEALTRFTATPQRGPLEWFTEASAIGRGLDLELVTAEAALAHLDRLPAGVRLNLNASPQLAESERFRALIGEWPGEGITLELTENAILEDHPGLDASIAELRERGVLLALDDVGNGYSGLSRLLQFRPDIVKLDRSLVAGIDHDLARQALATALVRFAASTRCQVVAEGVETEAELAALQALGVDLVQGFHVGYPVPFEELALVA